MQLSPIDGLRGLYLRYHTALRLARKRCEAGLPDEALNDAWADLVVYISAHPEFKKWLPERWPRDLTQQDDGWQ
jgi:hypothetical protein